MGLKYALAVDRFVGTPTYKLLFRFDGGNGSDTVVDSGVNGYTPIVYTTNDPSQHAQTNAQVLFGVSSFFSFRRGAPPGSGGGDSRLDWVAGTGLDFGSSPSVVIGGPIWPTFQTLGSIQVIFALQRNASNNLRLWYDDAGIVYYRSISGGVTQVDLTSTEVFTYGQWNWFFVSMFAGVTQLWVGTNAGGFARLGASGADASAYDMGSLGATTGRISFDAIASDGCMNCYLDHFYVATGQHIVGTAPLPVPTTQP